MTTLPSPRPQPAWLVALLIGVLASLTAPGVAAQGVVPTQHDQQAGDGPAATSSTSAISQEGPDERLLWMFREEGSYGGVESQGRQLTLDNVRVYPEVLSDHYIEVGAGPANGGTVGGYTLQFRTLEDEGWVEGRTYELARAPGRTPTHPGDLGFNACGGTQGEFTIHDLAEDLSRFRISFAIACGAGAPMSYGEVRWGPDTRQLEGLSAPHGLTWPEAEVGEPLVGGAVLVRQRAASTTRVGQPYLTGEHASDFVATSSCPRTMAPGSLCAADVTFTPSAAGPRHAVWHLPLESGSEIRVPLSGYGHGGVTMFHRVRPDADGGHQALSYGASGRYYIEDTLDDPGARDQVVEISTENFGGAHVQFASRPGEPLVVGRYENARHLAFRGAVPGIDLGNNYSYCPGDQVDASFEIHEIGRDDDGEVSRFAASWRQTCDGLTERGRIAFRASDDYEMSFAPTLDVTAPEQRYRPGRVAPVRISTSTDGVPALWEVTLLRQGRTVASRRVPAPSDGVLVLPVPVLDTQTLRVHLVDEPWTAPASIQLEAKTLVAEVIGPYPESTS